MVSLIIFNILKIILVTSIIFVLCYDWIYRHRKSKLKDVRKYIYSANESLLNILKREVLIKEVEIIFPGSRRKRSEEARQIYEYCQIIKDNKKYSHNEKILLKLTETLLVTQISEGILIALEKKSQTDMVVNQSLDISKISEIKNIYSEFWKEGIKVIETNDFEKMKNFNYDKKYMDKLIPYKEYIFEINKKLEVLFNKYGKNILRKY